MPIQFDSIEYENTGRIIYQNGWLDFFRTGPHRELLYPSLIALAMASAKSLSVNYQLVLKIFQVAFLFSTQLLLIVVLKKINVRDSIIKTAVFYFGISPATINAAFSVYYEIVAFPFVVIAVLLLGSLWSDIHQKKEYKPILGKALLFGLCFSLLAYGREVFIYVYYFLVLPFCISALKSLFKRHKEIFYRHIILIILSFALFFSATSYIKLMNARYNGNPVFCKTHWGILLGSASKRSQPISYRIIASHIATIPGNGVCRWFFSEKECHYADWFGSTEQDLPVSAVPKDHQEWQEARWVLEKTLSHPFQYLFFSIVESLKMPFWESTQIGYVGYPESITKFYNHPSVRFGLRLSLGLITITALLFLTFYLGRRQAKEPVLFFVWLTIMAYTFLYSLCYVVTRYALPIAAMYMVCIAFSMEMIIRQRRLKCIL